MNKIELIRQQLVAIGEKPNREGLIDTPVRVVKMWKEIFRGYNEKPPKITTFKNGKDGIVYDQMIVDTGKFYSVCEHHMMPFFGNYWLAYIPSAEGQVIGLSKIARIVDYYCARLQIQERLVNDIVEYLWKKLSPAGTSKPVGMALVMRGEHLCKTMRGAKKEGLMTTSKLKGVFLNEVNARNEFFNLIKL